MSFSKPANHATGWAQVQKELSAECVTWLGKRRAASWTRFSDQHKAEWHLRLIQLWGSSRAFPDTCIQVQPIPQIEDALLRCQNGTILEPEEISDIAQTIQVVCDTAKALQTNELLINASHPLFSKSDMDELLPLSDRVRQCIATDGTIRDCASPELAKLSKQYAAAKTNIDRSTQQAKEQYAAFLSDDFVAARSGRPVLPIVRSEQHRVQGIYHGISGTGKTTFIEPIELVAAGNTVRQLEHKIAAEQHKVLRSLTQAIQQTAESITSGVSDLAQTDIVSAASRLQTRMNAIVPTFSQNNRLQLYHVRHPGLALQSTHMAPNPDSTTSPTQQDMQGASFVVGNDLRLDQGDCFVLSGPNGGGKTVFLSTVAGVCYMAQAGLPIPAGDGSTIPWFAQIYVEMGDPQDVLHGLSSFTARLHNLSKLLSDCPSHCLIIIDEIAAGTNPQEGSAIAIAVLEEMTQHQATCLVSTHYQTLKEHASQNASFQSAAMGNDTQGNNNFRLRLGVWGGAQGLAAASAAGLPEHVLRRANEVMDRAPSIQSLEDTLLAQLTELEKEQKALQTRSQKLHTKEVAITEKALSLQKRRQNLHHQHYDGALEELRVLRRDIQVLKESLSKKTQNVQAKVETQTPNEVSALLHTFTQQEMTLRQAVAEQKPSQQRDSTDLGTAATIELLRPNTKVRVASLRATGTVVTVVSDTQVQISLGSFYSTVHVEDLYILTPNTKQQKNPTPPAKAKRGVSSQSPIPPAEAPLPSLVRTKDTTCDVRGKTVNESLEIIDVYIDRAMQQDRDYVFILHGHGTGVLKKKLRLRLPKHPCVSAVSAATKECGGDAITVLMLGRE